MKRTGMLVKTFQAVFIPLWVFTPKALLQELSRYQNNMTGDILENRLIFRLVSFAPGTQRARSIKVFD